MDKLKIYVKHNLGFGANVALAGIGVSLALNALINVAKYEEMRKLEEQGKALEKLGKALDELKSNTFGGKNVKEAEEES